MSRGRQNRVGARSGEVRASGRSVLDGASRFERTERLKKLRPPLLLLFLGVLTLATFWSVLRNDFIYYDDNVYVTQNESVRQGLTWQGLRWAFTTGHAANWHPLTWLSHMTDVSLFGMNPSGHHATNLALHVVNTLLLFIALRSLSGALWQSACVAALFAVHPAHVESVAWIAERKDLLSTVFWLATMWAYGSWVRRRTQGRYALVLLLFTAGLMSKPMLVTLPLVLLLIDYWPLGRLRAPEERPSNSWALLKRAAGLVLEKVPLFFIAAASSVVTFLVQRAGGAVGSLEKYPLGVRIANALVSYVRYLRMFVWPSKLAVFYPHPGSTLPAWRVLGATFLLVALTGAAVVLRRHTPYLFVGWFWFVVTLLPVIGLIQVGLQAMADRYTYVSFIGLFVAVTWGIGAIVLGPRYRILAWVAATATVLVFTLGAAKQTGYWKNSETLFLHALEITKDNDVVENNLGHYYNEVGRPTEALPHLSEAIRIRPNNPESYNNMGVSLFQLGRLQEADERFSQSLRLGPNEGLTLNNLARTRFLQGDLPGAVRLYEAAVAAAPQWIEVHRRFAVALLMQGKTAAAVAQWEQAALLAPEQKEARVLLDAARALERDPEDPAAEPMRRVLAAAHLEMSGGLQRLGRNAEAVQHLRTALKLVPTFADAHTELGTVLMREGHLDDAAAEFELAVRLDPSSATAHNDLGYAFFLKGRREAAIGQYAEALRLQPGFKLAQNNMDLALRQTGKPPERDDRPPSSSPH